MTSQKFIPPWSQPTELGIAKEPSWSEKLSRWDTPPPVCCSRTFRGLPLLVGGFSCTLSAVLFMFQAISERKHFIRAGRPAVGLMDNKPPPLDSWVWTPTRTLSYQSHTVFVPSNSICTDRGRKMKRKNLLTTTKKHLCTIQICLKDFIWQLFWW